MREEFCVGCKHLDKDGKTRRGKKLCKRFPKPEWKELNDWCGEHEPSG